MRDVLIKQYPQCAVQAPKRDYDKWGVCAKVLENVEDDVLVAMETFLRGDGFRVSAVGLNGLMVHRNLGKIVTETVLRATEQHVAAQTGWNVTLALKHWG